MTRTLFALLACGLLATVSVPQTQATGECVVDFAVRPDWVPEPEDIVIWDPPAPESNAAGSGGRVEECVGTSVDEGITLAMTTWDGAREFLYNHFFYGMSRTCAPALVRTEDAQVTVIYNNDGTVPDITEWSLPRGGKGLTELKAPGGAYIAQMQGHQYVVDYRNDAYLFGLIMHDSGLGTITFNEDYLADAVGYVDWFCHEPGGRPCGGHSHGMSTDEDWPITVRVIILCPEES